MATTFAKTIFLYCKNKKTYISMKKTLLLWVVCTFAILASAQTDMTSSIANPSFETDGTSGWTIKGMKTQSNSVFTRKVGTYYLESWVSIGQQLGNVSATQTLEKLPSGNYKLTANALHIQQTQSGSTTNKGAAQTGAYLFAGSARVAVNSMRTYTLSFSVIDAESDVEIGILTENGTGNWICVDNFKLQRVGDVDIQAYAQEVQRLVTVAEGYLQKGVQETVAEALTEAVELGNKALEGKGTDEEGKIIYDEAQLVEARTALETAIEAGKASRALYDALQERIDYGKTVLDWWEGVLRKTSVCNNLKDAIATAEEKMTDYTLTDALIRNATSVLNTRIKAVDKKIYCSTNACGTDAELQNNDSYWSYQRSMQSKHWIIFWEKGYGTEAPDAVADILANADRIFELYAGELAFITINQGKSKTDTYKMIIRLRYTDEWEANGSGIDDTIGMLTLSRWAYTSRGGQTVAHEIGHCFQYQTHCDNGNWNGWMYNWGQSTLNVFWEMCAQWQAYKYYPDMQFNNEWLTNTLNGLHRHPLCVDLRYNNYFIQDYFCHKHGMDVVGRLWNKSYKPEDPLQAYMRITMKGTTAQKLAQLGDEMWEYGARMASFDLDPIRDRGAATINKRTQTALTKDKSGFWWPQASNCIENWGNNVIRINAPTKAKTLYAEFVGEPGAEGYTAYKTNYAGWRIGFVALQKDGTRVYSEVTAANANALEHTVSFDCPAGCQYVWFVVSGAPTVYWTRDWLSWSEESTAEQWPYRVKFHQTNVYGYANNNTYPTAIADIADTPNAPSASTGVYTPDGRLLRSGTNSLQGLPSGLYIVGGRKVVK